MKLTLHLILGMALIAAAAIAGAWGQGPRAVGVPTGPTFAALDVFVDPGAEGLAAYQVEIKDAAGVAKIVGIEGGEGVYKAAPYYDPAAMEHERVIIGALSTSADLPKGLVRVARLHVMLEGQPKWQAKLMTAGAPGGRKLDGEVKIKTAD